jgi:hypothetical protein
VEFVARDDWSHFVHSYMTWMSYPSYFDLKK